MPSFCASRLDAISITNEIKIRMREFPTYHQKLTRLNSGDYSSSIIDLDTGHR
jgi:hypothetical protein